MSDEPIPPNAPSFIVSLRMVPGFIWPMLLCLPLTWAYLASGHDQTVQNMLVSSFSSFLTLLIPRAQAQQPTNPTP